MAFGSLAALGGSLLTGGLSSLFRKKPRIRQVATDRPEAIQAKNFALQRAMQGLQNPTAGFEPIANQARQQYNQQILPSIAERFTAMGAGGQGSSAFLGALRGSGDEFTNNLAANQAQYGLQNSGELRQLLGLGLGRTFENVEDPGGPSFLSDLFGNASQGLNAVGNYYGQQENNKNLLKGFEMLAQKSGKDADAGVEDLQTENTGQQNLEKYLRQFLAQNRQPYGLSGGMLGRTMLSNY